VQVSGHFVDANVVCDFFDMLKAKGPSTFPSQTSYFDQVEYSLILILILFLE